MSTILRISFLAAFAALTAAQTASAASGDWPQYGYTVQGRRENTHETLLTRKTVSRLAEAWSANIDTSLSSPMVANGVVYVGSLDHNLYAFDARSGAPLWHAATGAAIQSSPAVANGLVYIGSMDGRLYAFNAETGAPRWSTITGAGIEGSPTAADGLVFVGNDNGSLFALNAKTGVVRWTKSLYTHGPISTPAVGHGVVYFAIGGGLLDAYDVNTGALLWEQYTDSDYDAPGSPALDHGTVYVYAGRGIYAFDAASGAQRWQAGILSSRSSIAVAKGRVQLATVDHVLWDFSAATGHLNSATDTQTSIECAPAIANGVLYIGSDFGGVLAFDAKTGAQLWSAPTESSVFAGPTVSNGMLYVSSTRFHAYALGGGH
jgi:outer membrane protein assembly factor BamB